MKLAAWQRRRDQRHRSHIAGLIEVRDLDWRPAGRGTEARRGVQALTAQRDDAVKTRHVKSAMNDHKTWQRCPRGIAARLRAAGWHDLT